MEHAQVVCNVGTPKNELRHLSTCRGVLAILFSCSRVSLCSDVGVDLCVHFMLIRRRKTSSRSPDEMNADI